MNGFMIGARVEVRYHVKPPKLATVRATTTNGQISVTALGGKLVAQTTNGGVSAKDLSGGVDAQTTNGGVSVELASLGTDKVELKTTNGGIDVSGVKVEATGEQTRRRVEGRINGGGTPIELRTTNGGIRVRSRVTS